MHAAPECLHPLSPPVTLALTERQEENQTIGEKRNLAIQNASGDVICHFDDDDLYAPTYVETMV